MQGYDKKLTDPALIPNITCLLLPIRCGFVTDEVRGTVCSKVFKQRSNLERHIRSHTRTKSHRCEECGKCFVDSTRLKEHRWIHSDYKPHKCQHCDKVFRHLSHLR